MKNLSPLVTLWVEGHTTWGAAMLAAESGAENRGTILLETSLDDWRDQSARLDCGADGFVNAPRGVIRTSIGAGDVRGITGSLINRGIVEAGPETVFTGTLEAAGGTFVGPLRVRDTVLRVTGSPVEPTLIDLVGAGNRLLTDILANTILQINGTVNYGLARLTVPQGVANMGRIRLVTTSDDWMQKGSYLKTENGFLTNGAQGVIEVLAGTGDGRAIEGNMLNHGQITVESGATLEIGGIAPVFVQAAGRIASDGFFLMNMGRFEMKGGKAEGIVRLYDSTVLAGAEVVQPTTLRLVGAGCRLVGNLSPMITLWVEGTTAWGAAKLTAEPGAENRGVIHLETTVNDWMDRGSRLDCGAAGMVNSPGAVIRAVAGAGDPREIKGRLTNRGVVDAQVETEFIGTLEAAGGTYNGEFLVHDSDLSVTGSPAELTTILLEGPNNRLFARNMANTELWIRGNPRFGSGNLTAVQGLVNEGIIRLETTANDWVNRASQLTVEGGPLRNATGGVLVVNPGAGGPRTISAALDNAGLTEINASCSIGRSLMRHLNSGVVSIAGGTATFSGFTLDNMLTGVIEGSGTLDLSSVRFESSGTISPGDPVGTLTLAGTSRLAPSSVVEIQFTGVPSGIAHDRLVFNGAAYIQGELRLEPVGGVVPTEGSSFPVVGYTAGYGDFDRVTGTLIGEALKFTAVYQPTQLLVNVVSSSSTTEDAPTIVRHPANQEVVRGRPAWFGVTANGTSPFEYQWQLNGSDIQGATNSVLRIASATTADSGAYQVVVRNKYGMATSNPATLTVVHSFGTFIGSDVAGTTEVPVVSGDGVTIELFNRVGGGTVPAPAHLVGLEPDGITLSPIIDFPRPGTTVAVGSSFNLFFAETTTPPEQVSGISAANFILRHQFFLRITRDLDLDTETPDIDVRLGVMSDDGFYLAIGPVFISSVGDRSFAWTYRIVSFEGEGLYPVTLLFAANASGSSGLEFGWETAAHGTGLVPQSALYRSLTLGQYLISFEELPVGTVVSNQFAASGVVFETVSGALQVTADRPTEFVPVSPPNVYADPAVIAAGPVELDLRFVEPATGRPATVDFLSVYVIDAETTGALITAFSPYGDEIFRQACHGGGAALEEVRINAPDIFRVRIYLGETDDTAAIDHITFSSPQPLTQQHFELAIGQTVERDVPGPGAGVIESAGEEDLYTFTAAAGQTVFFDDKDSSTRRLFWELYDSKANLIFQDKLDGNDPGTRVLASTGDYHIRVFDKDPSTDTGTYSFELWSESPLIGRSPQSLTAYIGRDVALSVLAESRLPMQYQWKFNSADIPGATQPVLILRSVSLSDAGVYSVRVSNAVGSVESEPAVLTVDVHVPNLAVADVFGPSNAQAGQSIELTWTVTNSGVACAVPPWTEKISISADALIGNDQVVALIAATAPIDPHQSLVRTQVLTLPRTGFSGNVWFVVQVDTDDLLPESDESNNASISAVPTYVTPVLTLQLSKTRLTEGESTQARITRSGDLSAPLTVALTPSNANQLTLPLTVLIPAGRDSESFTVTALADGVVDGEVMVTIGATGAGYVNGDATLSVIDSDTPILGLLFSNAMVPEGSQVQGTVYVVPPLPADIHVKLESASADQLAVPLSLIIPGGQTNATFLATAIDDSAIESTLHCTVIATAAGLTHAIATIAIADNDSPLLFLSSAKPAVSETDGPKATTVTVTRSPSGIVPITLELESSDPSTIVVPRSVIISAGTASATVPVGAVDNSLLDGNKTVEIRAFLLETRTGKRIGHPTTAAIEVTDNEAPALAIVLVSELVPEGRTSATTGTVTRNTPTNAAILVQLRSNRPAEAIVPESVSIPAGHTSATFEVASVDDGVPDGNQIVVITAEAPGLAAAHVSLIVTDVNLPDLAITQLAGPEQGLTGAPFDITYRETNSGLAPARGLWKQRLFLSNDTQAGNDLYLGEVTFTGAIDPGLYVERTVQYRLPTSPGDYWLVVVSDAEDVVAESMEANNTTVSARPVRVAAAYMATVETAIELAPANTPVPLSGHAWRTGSETPAAFELVYIHLMVRDTRRLIAAITDANGEFSTAFYPLPGEAGHYGIGAAHPGETSASVQDTFTLVGM
ncbi:MAG TPA: CARDB domain-containing protein, partial [Verrucomicrobiota bacterium]|nr:CARDB domain-containing protein [Verrucomicrobiota bacterium]